MRIIRVLPDRDGESHFDNAEVPLTNINCPPFHSGPFETKAEETQSMLIEHEGHTPQVHPSSRVAPNATLCGDVTIGPNCSIGFGAVLVAESGSLRVGANCVIMDTAVIRGVRGNPTVIGENVLVGPRAYLTGCTVEDDAFLATGCTVFNGARIGRGAELRINAIVHIRTVLPPGAVVPLGWVAVGDPAQILPPSQHDRIWAVQKPLDFPRYVFGVERPPEGQTIMSEVMPRYAHALARWHAADRKVRPTDRQGGTG